MGRAIEWVTTLAALTFLAQPQTAPQATGPQQPPTFRSGIDIVRLDVSVLDITIEATRGSVTARRDARFTVR